MKFNPVVAAYIAAGVAGIFLAYEFMEWLKHKGGDFGGALDQAAENYGYTGAIAANDPQLKYTAAMIAYGKAKGVTTAFLFSGGLGWPTREDWYDGAGPAGYTYGSPNYPKAPEASMWDSTMSAFGF